MLIRCIRCKGEFQQQSNERFCGCKGIKQYDSELYQTKWKSKQRERVHFLRLGIYFQNPIYQWIREFVTTEQFTHYKSFKRQAKNY